MNEETQENSVESIDTSGKFKRFISRAEAIYLDILRAGAILIATGLLLWIAWLLLSSLYLLAQDPDSVEAEDVIVTLDDMVKLDEPKTSEGTSSSDANSSNSVDGFTDFSDSYYQLFTEKFAAFKQEDDKDISQEEFVERYLSGFEPLFAQSGAGDAASQFALLDELESDLELASGSQLEPSDFAELKKNMEAASALPVTVERLQSYKDTPKVRSERKVQRSRRERYCSYYSDYFQRCYSYDYRSVPYTQTIVEYFPPEGIVSYDDLFGMYQANYLSQLTSGRQSSASDAARERAERRRANEEGYINLGSALRVGGVFFALMFFFLLVAIERHQRRLALKLGEAQELETDARSKRSD